MSIPKYIVIPEESLKFMPLTSRSELWHKDDDHPSCELCNKKFTFFNRRHHCRNCGKVICDDCLMAEYTHPNQNPYRPHMVCKLCKYCVLNQRGKDSEECKKYMEEAKFVDDSEKQFIADDFSINGEQIQVGDTLTITNVTLSKNYASHVFYKARVESFESVGNNMINLALTETNDVKLKLNDKVYLQNEKASQQRNDKIPSRIIIYDQNNTEFVGPIGENVTRPIPSGYVLVTDVTPPAQGGGYKYRKNKSKRKNKRSVKRRMSNKRSNIRRKNKKVTKRLRKSRRRRARR
jgi:hypothetical protein